MLDIILMGFMYGLTLSSLALGLSLVFGVTRILNIAQGEFYMLGAFIALILQVSAGLNFWLAVVVASIMVAFIAIFFEMGLHPFYGKEPLFSLILTLGYSYVLRDAAYSFSRTTMLLPMGAGFYTVESPIKGGLHLFGMVFPYYRFSILAIIIVSYILLWFLVRKTKYGLHMRATTQNPELLSVNGVNVKNVYRLTFSISAAVAAMSGILMGPVTTVYSDMGHEMIVLAFIAVIVGGLGNIRGSLIASIVLSQIFVFLSMYLEPYWSQTLLGLVAMVALLISTRRKR